MAMVTKKFRVLRKSHINGAIAHPGEVVSITYDDEKQNPAAAHLEEVKDVPKPEAKADETKAEAKPESKPESKSAEKA